MRALGNGFVSIIKAIIGFLKKISESVRKNNILFMELLSLGTNPQLTIMFVIVNVTLIQQFCNKFM